MFLGLVLDLGGEQGQIQLSINTSVLQSDVHEIIIDTVEKLSS